MRFLSFWILYSLALTIGLARKGLGVRVRPSDPPTTPNPRKVLIIGAGGGTGRQLVVQALERGYEVTAFVRNPAQITMQNDRLRIVQGDVLDYLSVDAAVRGQDAVLSALGHGKFFGPSKILSQGTQNIVRAMQAHGVRRLVCVTSLGIGSSAGRLGIYYTFLITPLVLPFYFWDKARQEQVIASSQLDWVIVRPGLLTNAPARGASKHGPTVGNYLTSVRISRADVADFMLNQLTDNRYLHSSPGVCW